MKTQLITKLLEMLLLEPTTGTATTGTTETNISPTAHPFNVGANYFIRTVTHHFTGRLVEIHDKELVLIDAAWIADDGRLANTIVSGEYGEIEPYPDGERVIINRASLIDAIEIKHALPRKQK